MRVALIATVFNEADNLARWWKCIMGQTQLPDEIAVVDGGSQDGTWERLQELAKSSPVPMKLERFPSNIAGGRNRAITLTQAEIVASTDAGSFPDAEWLEELTRPLLNDPSLDAVGGKSVTVAENDFQRFLLSVEGQLPDDDGLYPSSRNLALRRSAWAAVGGYPEWMTLAGEDALYNFELHATGQRFACNNRAVVRWAVRPTFEAYLKLLYRNAFGAAEAGLYTSYFIRRLVIAAFPPLLLLSKRRFKYLRFRFLKNAYSALGWLNGKWRGRKPPKGWVRIEGVLLSPEAQRSVGRTKNDSA